MILAICIGCLVLFIDQLTKYLVQAGMVLGESIPIVPGFFQLCYIRNTGAAWGMLSGGNLWLAIISIIMLVLLIRFRRSIFGGSLLDHVVLGLMLGGIWGNLIDRVKLSYVVDFLYFHWGPHYFPAFNVADSAICSAVALYMLSQFLTARRIRDESSGSRDGV